MSSVNVDKALQIRPPIRVYQGEVAAGANLLFDIPGVPNNIGGAGPEGKHTMITNFISVQCCSRDFAGTPNLLPVYIAFGDENVTANPISASTDMWASNPEPAVGGCLEVQPGETVRFDLSDLFKHGVAPALVPIEYMAVSAAPGAANAVAVRIWRSSGR
ncbi:MAG: hypothetical protein GY772_26985 [bacterium]|nr:hypothetical protein [bacterium]